MEKATKEMEYSDKFDIILVNDKLDETLSKAEELVRNFLKNKT